MKRLIFLGVVAFVCSGATLAAATPEVKAGAQKRYVVLYEKSASPAAARPRSRAPAGESCKRTRGSASRPSSRPIRTSSATATSSAAIEGVAPNRVIGTAPAREPKFSVELMRELREATKARKWHSGGDNGRHGGNNRVEPLAPLQWDMKMIHATADGSYDEQRGRKDVLVGIIDTGVDGNHPDIAPNFSKSLSRNFTTDIPLIDGPCADEPDHSCSDPADVDENSHGTHVASTIGSPINKLGVAGVAPNVTLVNLRAGQDSGFFFLQPSVDALTYAGDHGIDVVNMSYFIDPWLFNCRANPADSPAEQAEQRTIIEATQRALDYAHQHGVTLIAAAGNEHTNLAQVTTDGISPDYPPGTERTAHDRQQLPEPAAAGQQRDQRVRSRAVEGEGRLLELRLRQDHRLRSGRYFRDAPWTAANPQRRRPEPDPRGVSEERGRRARRPESRRDTEQPVRGPRLPRQHVCLLPVHPGHSMASPHAVGVAALIVSEFGHRGRRRNQLEPAPHAGVPRGLGDRYAVPDAEPVQLRGQGPSAVVHGVL